MSSAPLALASTPAVILEPLLGQLLPAGSGVMRTRLAAPELPLQTVCELLTSEASSTPFLLASRPALILLPPLGQFAPAASLLTAVSVVSVSLVLPPPHPAASRDAAIVAATSSPFVERQAPWKETERSPCIFVAPMAALQSLVVIEVGLRSGPTLGFS